VNLKDIEGQLTDFLAAAYTPEAVADLADRFHRDGFVNFDSGRLVPAEIAEAVRADVDQLIQAHKERRDLVLGTTGSTPRRMSVVKSQEIEKSDLIRNLSHSKVLLNFLAGITREEIVPEVSDDERYLITHQEFNADTHGWHWGDYSFALIWALVMPSLSYGGMLQCVPHTHWDKSNPRINEILSARKIDTYGLASGDIYLLRTDTTLHRTVPLAKDGAVRTILNMTWASRRDLQQPIIGDDRWWDNPEAKAAQSVGRVQERTGE
jgi:hypothetical protein